MKRRQVIKHLQAHGCELVREGSNHSWWANHRDNKRSAVPRHTEIDDLMVRKICRELGIPPLK